MGFVLLFLYFLLTVFILPSEFLMTEQLIPQPIFEAILSETEIKAFLEFIVKFNIYVCVFKNTYIIKKIIIYYLLENLIN